MTIIDNTNGSTETVLKFNSRFAVDTSLNCKVSIKSRESSTLLEFNVAPVVEDYYLSVTIPSGLEGIEDDSELTIFDSNDVEIFRDRIHGSFYFR